MGPAEQMWEPCEALVELKRRLCDRRDELDLMMINLETATGLSHSVVSKAFNGPHVPSERTVRLLAKPLKMDSVALLALRDIAAGPRDRPEEQFATREFFGDLIEKHTRLFAGRDAESAQITDYIQTQDSGYVFVEALSGYGKTSLLADLVSRNPDFRYHFISQAYSGRGDDVFDPVSPDDVLECLCEQLDPAHVSGRAPESLQRQFRSLLAHEPKKPTVVVLDAIDELSDPKKFRHLFPGRLPRGLVVVLSGRTQGARSCLEDIALSREAIGLHMSLQGLDQAALLALLRMAGGKGTDLAEDADFVAEVHRLSKGDPFYVRFLVEDTAAGILTRDNIDRTPSGLEGYLDQQLEQLNRSAHREEHVGILGYLLEAGTLSGRDLQALVPGLSWLNFDSILREIHRFLLVHRRVEPGEAPSRGNEDYSFCHDRFRQYFRIRAGLE